MNIVDYDYDEVGCRAFHTNAWYPENPAGGKTWWLCTKCHKPSVHALNQCDTCNKLFKGVRPNIKFAYTCPECE